MIFTKVEIEIAKQMLKIGLTLLGLVVLFSFSLKLYYYVTGGSVTTASADKTIANPKATVDTTIPKASDNMSHEVPLSLEIPDFNISTSIQSPTSNDVQVLDTALSKSAVYYPGSGTPGSNNTLIFGHSTTFSVVINQAYKVFNNLKNVTPGTLIYVKTQSATFVYKARQVKRVSKYTSWIQFKTDSPMLTLATCDSFGKASDRWVLEADYVGVK